MQRYGLVALLVVTLGVVRYIERHPSPATPAPTVPLAAVEQSTQVILPDRLTHGIRIVSGDKALYYIDAVVDGSGPHPIPAVPSPIVKTAPEQSVTVVGWAVDAPASRTAAAVIGIVDAKTGLAGTYGTSRPDVAKAFNNPAFTASGYKIIVPARLLSPGPHSFQILILSVDRSKYYQASKIITIEAGAWSNK